MNYCDRLISAAPFVKNPLDCRKLKLSLSFHMLKAEQVSELANRIVRFAEQLAGDEIITSWSYEHKNVSAKQAKERLSSRFDPAVGLSVGFEGYIRSPVIHNVATLKKHQSFVTKVNPVYMYSWPYFDMDSVDYHEYFDELFIDGKPDNSELIKKIYHIFCEPNRRFLWFHAHADLAFRFSAKQYQSHPEYYYGEAAFGISAFSAGDIQDLVADAMEDFATTLSKEYVNINALIGLQPKGITDDPYMRYFGLHGVQDGSHEDAACTAREWYPYYYLHGIEWLNIVSPQTKELILNPYVPKRDGILVCEIPGGSLKVQSAKPISAYSLETALAMKHILRDTLYPGKTAVSLKSLFPKVGQDRVYSWCPRSDWAIVPIEEHEIGIIGTDLVYISENSMTYSDS